MRLSIGTRLGPYEILAPLGRGGMGEVYRARDSRLSRDVAVKILPEHLAADPDALTRFEREAIAVASLSHPHIVSIFDFGQENGIRFAVMELLEGETLREQIKGGPIPPERVAKIGVAIAEGLSAAHSKRIVHRDLKPENIFITSGGLVKILDFGLARTTFAVQTDGDTSLTVDAGITMAGAILGTIAYMSPEQVRGGLSETTSDIFSLGSVLFEMVTGKPAFLRASVAETMAAILNENPERIAVSINLDRIIFQCLAKDVGDRFTTASAVASALSLPAEEVQARKSSEKIESLAVLPFLNAAGASEIDYLCDGITESLINNLSQIPKLRVVPRSTVFRYKDMGMDPQRFVLGLGVRTVLTGKILQRGDILVVQAELVDIATDSQLWGQKYSRKVTDIFAVEEEISREIAAALQIKLNNTEKKQLSRRSTEDGEAYQLYLKGRYLWNQRKRTSLERAVGYFQQAIERDPDYALAYAGLADCFIVMGSFQFWPPQEAFPRAQATAQRAIEIDEGLAEAHIVLAIVNAVFERNGKAALREFERAIRLDANYAVAHQWFGSHLCFVGDFEAGLRELRLAQQLEPLSPMINVQLGVGLYLARHYDKSAQVLRNMIAFEPDFWPAHFFLGLVSTEQLDNSRALEEMNRSSELSGRHPLTLSGLGYAFGRAGERHNSVRILEELHVLARTEYVAPDHFALIHLALDDETLALEQLHEVVQQRSPYGAWLAVDPRLDALRTDVRFQDILRNFCSRSEE